MNTVTIFQDSIMLIAAMFFRNLAVTTQFPGKASNVTTKCELVGIE
jgi:hypothetical protein